MRRFLKLIASAVCLFLVASLASCADLGAGDGTSALGDYFSEVRVLSEEGGRKYSMSHFTDEIESENGEIPVVVAYEEYCYVGFLVADRYTLSLSEFAFFARSEKGNGVLDLEFYIVDQMPTDINGSDGGDASVSSPASEESSEVEVGSETDSKSEETTLWEDQLLSDNRFYGARFSIGEKWDSVLLQFDGAKTVKGGEYVVVRIKNNCASATGEDTSEPIAFTFNYLLFYVNSAHES